MTAHCSTCSCADDATPPQPATSSPGIRRLALDATDAAVKASKEKRGAGYGGQR